MGGEVARTPREADVARHTLAKATYERLFDALVAEINGALAPADEVQGPTSSGTSSGPPTSATMGGGRGGGYRRELFVGLLDIFGSEVLEVNGFEQLMINYANDKLQFFFTQARA
jgi:myosin heavy subunit